MPLLYIHNARNFRPTHRALIFRHFRITKRTTYLMLTWRELCIDAILKAHYTLVLFIIGFFGIGEVRC
jgi:hypothetical protein